MWLIRPVRCLLAPGERGGILDCLLALDAIHLPGPASIDRRDGLHPTLTSKQKGILAVRAVTDPFNLLTIATFSAISVAADSHSVYGPGFAGWGRPQATLRGRYAGDFSGIYVLPSVFHEDPRYHRMPKASVKRRIEHALIHTIVSQHDDGSMMLNYATLLKYPLSAEISNLYVPDIGTNAPDTAKRVLVGYATDPIGPLVAEFLPDFAKRVHIHMSLPQQILNRIALGSGGRARTSRQKIVGWRSVSRQPTLSCCRSILEGSADREAERLARFAQDVIRSIVLQRLLVAVIRRSRIGCEREEVLEAVDGVPEQAEPLGAISCCGRSL